MAKQDTTIDQVELLDLDVLGEAAECLKTLAHPHRLRMVQMLLRGQYTVGQLAAACSIPSHMASEHLRLMQRCGLLASRRDGRRIYYKVAQPHLAEIMGCIEARFGAESDELDGEPTKRKREGHGT